MRRRAGWQQFYVKFRAFHCQLLHVFGGFLRQFLRGFVAFCRQFLRVFHIAVFGLANQFLQGFQIGRRFQIVQAAFNFCPFFVANVRVQRGIFAPSTSILECAALWRRVRWD